MNALLASPVFARLGWALLHALWEVTLVVLVAALVLHLMRGRSPRLRYAVAVLALCVSVLLPLRRVVLTPRPSAAPSWMVMGTSGLPSQMPEVPASGPSTRTRMEDGLGRTLPWIVGGWGAGVLVCLLRLGGGWIWLQRLRWRKAELAPDALQARLLGLCRRAGLRRAVTLLTCDGIRGPSVVGLLRPAILVPAGWFLHLPADHVEALLAHELAHVLRHDYAVNLLQSVVEVLLFYHPGVWWLSRHIRAERELACDAFAARLMGDPLPLAEALLNLETRALEHIPYELSPAAHGGSLMERIRQLLSPQSRTSTPSMVGMLVLGCGLLSLPLTGATWPAGGHTLSHSEVRALDADEPPASDHPLAMTNSRSEAETLPVIALKRPPEPATTGECMAVLVRKNKFDAEGYPIPHEWVISIQARNAPLLQVWDAFEALMKEDLGPRGEKRSTLQVADLTKGPAVFTFDLHESTPSAIVLTLEAAHGGPRRPSGGERTQPEGFKRSGAQ